jgi:5-(carboxyamino)imidazole ribonucleotide mutase
VGKVLIVMGSRSDVESMKGASKCLREFSVPYEAHILSAHRVPEVLEKVLARLEPEGFSCVIAGAGMAAHLPGVVASKTILPVIGVPLDASFKGLDALLSIVQMPKSIPVATVAVNNSYNAGMLAVQIIAAGEAPVREKLAAWRKKMKEDFVSDGTVLTDF